MISSGIRDIILGTDSSDYFSGVFASELGSSGETEVLDHIKRAVNFTEKTRYLFQINKGLSPVDVRANPFLVNEPVEDRPVPFENICYVGDGLTDIPCFSVVEDRGGQTIGIVRHEDPSSRVKSLRMMNTHRDRIREWSAPNFQRDRDVGLSLEMWLESRLLGESVKRESAL